MNLTRTRKNCLTRKSWSYSRNLRTKNSNCWNCSRKSWKTERCWRKLVFQAPRNCCGNWKTTSCSEELDEEELELLEDDELEEEGGALLEESGGSGAEELGRELEDELLEEEELELLEEELELLLGLGSNSNESPPPAELLDESPSSTSWYRLTRVRTVSPSLPAGVFSASR